MLQHDQRYLLAEAVYFLLAFFLTLSDHREGIAKASKVPHDIPIQDKQKGFFARWITTHNPFAGEDRATVNISKWYLDLSYMHEDS